MEGRLSRVAISRPDLIRFELECYAKLCELRTTKLRQFQWSPESLAKLHVPRAEFCKPLPFPVRLPIPPPLITAGLQPSTCEFAVAGVLAFEVPKGISHKSLDILREEPGTPHTRHRGSCTKCRIHIAGVTPDQ
jgi:hypothetical protein